MLLQAVIPHIRHAGGLVVVDIVGTLYPVVCGGHIVVTIMVERIISREYQIR